MRAMIAEACIKKIKHVLVNQVPLEYRGWDVETHGCFRER